MKSIYKKNSITQLKLTLVGLLTVLLLIQLVRPQKNTSLRRPESLLLILIKGANKST